MKPNGSPLLDFFGTETEYMHYAGQVRAIMGCHRVLEQLMEDEREL